MYIPRALESAVLRASRTFPVLLLTGPRQVGKTTLLHHLSDSNRTYVSLDDPDARRLAKTDPALFMQRFPPPVTIDEIQYAPELFPYIKMNVDSAKRYGDFWLTGSQTYLAMKNVSESLAGRVAMLRMLGLSGSEISGIPSEPFDTDSQRLLSRTHIAPKLDLMDVYKRIHMGGMPALYVDESINWETFFYSYVSSYLQRDIRDLSQVADETSFYNFMISVAARTAKPVVYDELARDAGISAPTAKKWLSLLASSHIIALVQPYHNSILKRMVKMPIMHFLDTGLCAWLLKWINPESLERGAMSGSFMESWVFSEIYKSYLNDGKEPPLLYYRDKDKREIDLLIYVNGTLYPIEIKKSGSAGHGDIRSFSALSPLTDSSRYAELEQLKVQIGTGAVISLASDLLPIDRRNWSVPAWLI